MTPAWSDFVAALGEAESNPVFQQLVSKLAEAPLVEDGPIGDTRYYSFYQTGIEFRLSVQDDSHLTQVSFFLEPVDRYQCYSGELIDGVRSDWDEASLLQAWGSPSSSGGGKPDMLIGYIHRWVKYKRVGYAVHFEFSKNGVLRGVSLIKAR